MNVAHSKVSFSDTAGFTLIELLIVLALVGVLSAAAVPSYRDYLSSAQIAKFTNNYNHAVRIARQEYGKNTSRLSLGLLATLPSGDASWIKVFDRDGKAMAVDGGPAYRPGHQPDNEDTPSGAVYVRYHSDHVCISRSEFHELTALRTRIFVDSITISQY